MNKIKSILALLLCASMLFALCACGGETPADDDSSKDTTEAVTTEADTTEAAAKAILTIKFVDEEGNNVLGGFAQFCNSSNCFLPNYDETDGSCTYFENLFEKVEAGDYLTITAPAGYTVKEPVVDANNKVYFEGGETEVTVILTKAG